MNFSNKTKEKEQARIDLTPMIDIVFQLLIFFMVSTTFVVAPGLKLNLPKTSSSETIEQRRDLTVSLGTDDSLFLNDRKILIKDLEADLRAASQSMEDPTLIIKADGDVKHSSVVEIMDVARKIGLNKLAIATEPKQTQP